MSTETQEVTITVPKPPKGWVIEKGRRPQCEETCFIFFEGNWVVCTKYHEWHENNNWKYYFFAFPAPKRKRLMTPAELAGKWLCWNASDRSLIVAFSDTHVWPGTANQGSTVSNLHDQKCGYSVTHNSPILPLEIEDDQ